MLSCKMLKEATLLCLQQPVRPWGPPVAGHLPHDAEQLKRKQCQLCHGKVAILLSALCIDHGKPPLGGIVEARRDHEELLRLLDPQAISIHQDLDSLCPEGPINI